MRSAAEHAMAFVGRDADPTKRALDRCRRHQRYVERSGGFQRRANEVEADENGKILVGNIGSTPAERESFWHAASKAEVRRDARLQDRIVVELPHWVSAADRRQIVERFGAVLDQHKLGWFAGVHLPDRHGDTRNFHGHFLIGTRPIMSPPSIENEHGWIFSDKKNRELQGANWIRHLRHEFARVMNEVAEAAAQRDGRAPERIFFPGRAIEIGIMDAPGAHLGPARAALLRRGIGTPKRAPTRNLFDILEAFARAHEFDKAALSRASDSRELIVSVGDAEQAVTACGRLLMETIGDVDATVIARSSKPSRLVDLIRSFDDAARLIAAAQEAGRRLADDIERQSRDAEKHATRVERHSLPERIAERELATDPRPIGRDATTIAPSERDEPLASPERAAEVHTAPAPAQQKPTKRSARRKAQQPQGRPIEAPLPTKLVDDLSFHRRYADDADALARAARTGRGSNRMWFSHEVDPAWVREQIMEKILEASDWLPAPRLSSSRIEERDGDLLVHIGDFPRIRIEYSRAHGWNVARTDRHPEGRLPYGDGPLGSRFSGDFWIGVVRTLVTHAALAPGMHAIRNEIQEEMKDTQLHVKDGYGVLGSYERPRGDDEPRIVVRADGGYLEYWGFEPQLEAVFKNLIVRRRDEDVDIPLSIIMKTRAEKFCQNSPMAVGMSAKEWAAYEADLASRQGSPPARPWPERVYLGSDTTEARNEQRQLEQAQSDERKAEHLRRELRFHELLEEEEKKRKPGVLRTIAQSFVRWLGGEGKDREHSRAEEPTRDRQTRATPTPHAEPRPPSRQPSTPDAKPDKSTATPPSPRRGRDEGRGG
ncbi:MAG: MobA/MobL family protein [Tagaea sp.]